MGNPGLNRIRFVELPNAFHPVEFFRTLRATRQRIRALIEEARYLSFAICGIWGDWAAVACLEAAKMNRPYSIWTDRVEYQVLRKTLRECPYPRRILAEVESIVMPHYHKRLIRRSAVGLFNGMDCYEEYSPYVKNSFRVFDIHLSPEDAISPEQIDAKINRIGSGEPLRICYMGRAAEMKGPLDWLEVMRILRDKGIDYQATWLGDGPMLEQARQKIVELNLESCVIFPGFTGNRSEVLQRFRTSDLFVFCHKTPESPRCLIEALISGCPIVGYESAYARDLIQSAGGGEFTELNNPTRLAEAIERLAGDRPVLVELTRSAARSGTQFSDKVAFGQRSDIIKKYL
jgi:glycosyltransferase involved in cell wall biosynthesis